MLTAWVPNSKGLHRHEDGGCAIPVQAVWLDAKDITKEEEGLVEGVLGIDVPTRAEMLEIEASSRLYREGEALVMTTTLLVKTETLSPESTPVTFILTPERLVTLRYDEPWSFRMFSNRAAKSGVVTADMAFAHLMDTTIERLADMLELVALELDNLSRQVFHAQADHQQHSLQRVLQKIGSCGHIISKVRESLTDKHRVVTYAGQNGRDLLSDESHLRVLAMLRDVQTLSDHATFMASKNQFLLDACLGLINVEQNKIFKFFTVVSVVFMPLNILAGMGGMSEFSQFAVHDTNLPWQVAYGLFLVGMVLIAWGTWELLVRFAPGGGDLRWRRRRR